MKSWRIIAVLLLCLILVGTIACSPLGGKEETTQQLVKVVRDDLIISVSGSGNIVVSNEAKLTFGSSGRIAKIYVAEGDEVSKGDVLARLDTGPLELALAQAQAALEQNKAAVAQAKAAVDDAEYNLNYLTTIVHASQDRVDIAESQVEAAQSQLEAAEAQLETAEQALAEAQKQLDEATITAPFAGVVASVDADEGDSISAMMTIIHVVDLASMELEADVDEIDIAEVKLGQRAIIEVDALPDVQFEGSVTYISPLPSLQAGVVGYKVKISLDIPPDSGLKIGMSATADIVVQEWSNVLLVPSRAITQDSQGNPVVKVIVNEQIEERAVVTGLSDGFQTEIVDGLKEGDIVVVEMKVKTTEPGFPF